MVPCFWSPIISALSSCPERSCAHGGDTRPWRATGPSLAACGWPRPPGHFWRICGRRALAVAWRALCRRWRLRSASTKCCVGAVKRRCNGFATKPAKPRCNSACPANSSASIPSSEPCSAAATRRSHRPPRPRALRSGLTIRSGSTCFNACMRNWPGRRPSRGWSAPRTARPCLSSKPLSPAAAAPPRPADIVFKGHLPPARPADAHDVLGTWKVVSGKREMSLLPRNIEELTAILNSRHARVMEGRPEQGPGRFKTEANRAGSTFFVAPELVSGTLAKGFEIYRSLAAPLHRAIFMMFLISEVHPFADVNGRVARIMMNAELVASGESRIVVPTVYRNNYLMALKALSQNGITGAVVRMLDFAQRYTSAVDFADLNRARFILERTNAFADPNEADARGISLILPTPDMLADAARL